MIKVFAFIGILFVMMSAAAGFYFTFISWNANPDVSRRALNEMAEWEPRDDELVASLRRRVERKEFLDAMVILTTLVILGISMVLIMNSVLS